MGIYDRFKFGKYKRWKLSDVIKKDIHYVIWRIKYVNGFKIKPIELYYKILDYDFSHKMSKQDNKKTSRKKQVEIIPF